MQTYVLFIKTYIIIDYKYNINKYSNFYKICLPYMNICAKILLSNKIDFEVLIDGKR